MEEIKPELIDELLKGYQKPEDLDWRERSSEAVDESGAGAGIECRVDASLGI
jgi:hypothetical protein